MSTWWLDMLCQIWVILWTTFKGNMCPRKFTSLHTHTHSCSCPCHWLRPKMVKNIGKQKKTFLHLMRWGNMHPKLFFSFGGTVGGVGFLLFPKCSHKALIVFPNMFPIASSLYLISFALLFIHLFIYLH